MIASLSGHIQNKSSNSIILDVHGVGYELVVSGRTLDKLPEVGGACFLLVQTILREDSLTLYGFANQRDKEIFLLLITVSGIGPKLALTILSGISGEELQQAVVMKNFDRLTALPGIGKKTAQRICMELSEKMGSLDSFVAPLNVKNQGSTGSSIAHTADDALSALINLGYPRSLAWQALQATLSEHQETDPQLEDLIRFCLQWLNSLKKNTP